MAAEGASASSFYAAASVCNTSRTALLDDFEADLGANLRGWLLNSNL